MTFVDGAPTQAPTQPDPAIVARFDPMLRILLTFGLVERDPEGANGNGEDGHWRLTSAVQRRLESLSSPVPPAEKLIYFGHRCGSCGARGPTRYTVGMYVCEACRATVDREHGRAGA